MWCVFFLTTLCGFVSFMRITIWCVELFEFLLNCSTLSCCLLPLPPLSQEGDDYEVIPNSKFCVSRTANKDNSSAYHISGKKATFKEVGALLRSHGIDLDHNRFLILQVIVFFFYVISSSTSNSAFLNPCCDHPILSFFLLFIFCPFPSPLWVKCFVASLKPCLSMGITCCTGIGNERMCPLPALRLL